MNISVKFNVYMNIYKFLDYYELILSVPRVQDRHKKPDEKHTLFFQVDGKMYI